MAQLVVQTGEHCEKSGAAARVCGYHRDRAQCSFSGFFDTGDPDQCCEDGVFQVARTPDIRAFGSAYVRGKPPAGGWYLVQSQREWLTTQFTRLFAAEPERPRLLISGCAGHVHFFGTLLIALAAMERAGTQELEIVVADRCDYPLDQIEALMSALRAPGRGLKRFLGRAELKTPQAAFPLDAALIKARPEREALERVTVKTVQTDITALDAATAGTFDIVTEHFLTSMADKKMPMIAAVRAAYARVLKPGGAVLSADGFERGSTRYREFLELCGEAGFTHDPAQTRFVWDPYGLPSRTLETFDSAPKSAAPLAVQRDNALSVFYRSAQ